MFAFQFLIYFIITSTFSRQYPYMWCIQIVQKLHHLRLAKGLAKISHIRFLRVHWCNQYRCKFWFIDNIMQNLMHPKKNPTIMHPYAVMLVINYFTFIYTKRWLTCHSRTRRDGHELRRLWGQPLHRRGLQAHKSMIIPKLLLGSLNIFLIFLNSESEYKRHN